MKNLADLKSRKEMLKKNISELEDTFAFKNPKESLSAFTQGFTNQFTTDKVDESGSHRLGIKPAEILSFLTGGASDNFIKKKLNKYGEEKIGIDTQSVVGSITENALKLGLAAIATNYAKKKLYQKSWKKKLIGVAFVYLTPFLLKFLREKLDEFQQKEILESLNKII